MSRFEKDLSQGNVLKQLMLFALPFIVSNIIQSLYSVADMIIVGQFSGTASMSGVNTGGQITLLITNMVIGLCAGATVLIAQYMGRGARKELNETIGTLFTSLIVLAVIITGVMICLRDPSLRLVQTPAESFSEARDYLTVTMLGTVFIFGYNALSAVMRGMGDSKNPLIFVGIACVINVFLDLLLVAKYNMGAKGAAIATVISQAVSMILCIIYLKRNGFVFDFNVKSFRFHRERFKMLLKIGLPTSVQNVVVGLSFTFLIAMVNTLGVTASAAVGAVGKFNAFAILPSIAMSSSIAAMSAQNIGAGQWDRAVLTMKAGTAVGFIISLVIFCLAKLFPEPILMAFSDDREMVAAGIEYLNFFSYDYIIVPALFGLGGLFIGSGHTTFSLINSVMSSLLIRIPASYFFGITAKMGLRGLGMGAPLASSVALVASVFFLFFGQMEKVCYS